MLTAEQVDFYQEKGYLRLRQVFTPEERAVLSDELERILQDWAVTNEGWHGPWRQVYMQADVERRAQLTHTNDFHIHSGAWTRAVFHPRLVEAVADLIGPEVELHHTTLHCKPPETGMPFPVHQDSPFYPHEGVGYVDAVVHVDASTEENGCLKFIPGSHRGGHIEHVLRYPDGRPCTPHLPTDKYFLSDAVPCPADAGDVVLFSLYTIHGSEINRTDTWRRLVRVGYRDPRLKQLGGHAQGRPGWMVRGVRPLDAATR